MNVERGHKKLHLLVYIFAIIGFATMFYSAFFSGLSASFPTIVSAQQDPFLSQRLTQIEQRFSLIETRLNNLERTANLPAITSRTNEIDSTELRLLGSQIEMLQLRLAAVECGLVKLDERTLTPAVRQARAKADAETDRCRQNPNAPLPIIARP